MRTGALKIRDDLLRELRAQLQAEGERAREASARAATLEARAKAAEEALAQRDQTIGELHRATDSHAAETRRLEIDLASRTTTIRHLEQQLERSIEEARQKDIVAHDLQLQLAERSAWAFRMVEGLMPHRFREGTAAPRPEAEPDAASQSESVQHPEPIQETSQPPDHVGALQSHVDSTQEPPATEPELPDARQTPYQQLVRRATTVVKESVPADATVVVVSKGDENLLELGGRRGWHFPQTETAVYAGHYPADSVAAVDHLERLRTKGAQFLLLPATSRWWLDHYANFAHHLDTCYRRIVDRDDVGILFDLRRASPAAPAWSAELLNVIEDFQGRYRRPPVILDCDSGLDVASAFPQHATFAPPSEDRLPYLDSTVDIVMTSDASPRAREARRVARRVLATVMTGRSRSTPSAVHLQFDWLEPRQRDMPSVSIIIPCHNGPDLTDACLAALQVTLPRRVRGEVIVVDDASTDGTRVMLSRWTNRDKRIKVLRNRKNLGFLRSCNRAATAARGEILVFLNNDTVPAGGWLTALLTTFHTHPDAGAVGGKLVLPDGTLQEAGSLVFRDGSAMNFGRGDRDIDRPLFNYVREVDYCSGALLATPRRLFHELGGFDPRYVPAYYEDTDYCFKIRENGRRVYYQPAARVTHHEGASCGTDLASGVKRYQVVNRDKFVERWKTVLEHQPDRPCDETFETWQRLAVRSA